MPSPLERLRRLAPTTHDMPAYAFVDVLVRLSVTKSAWHSARARGLVLVGRGSAVRVRRGGRLRVARGSVLIVGIAGVGQAGAAVEVRPHGTFEVRGVVQVMRAARVLVDWHGTLTMEAGSYLNEGAAVTCGDAMRIGPGCAISTGVTVMDTDTHRLTVDGLVRAGSAPVRLGERCWIGANATVLKGVTIGDGAVVAAGSLVTKDVGAGELVAGEPARSRAADVSWQP